MDKRELPENIRQAIDLIAAVLNRRNTGVRNYAENLGKLNSEQFAIRLDGSFIYGQRNLRKSKENSV